MVTLYRAYSSTAAAHEAVEAVRAAGVPGRDIWLLTGRPSHDVRDEPAGNFAGRVAPGAPVGGFAGSRRVRRGGAGGFAGDPDHQRQGSFADAEFDVVVTCDDDRARVVGHPELDRLLQEATVSTDDLHAGRPMVLVDVADIPPGDVEARLEQADRAA